MEFHIILADLKLAQDRFYQIVKMKAIYNKHVKRGNSAYADEHWENPEHIKSNYMASINNLKNKFVEFLYNVDGTGSEKAAAIFITKMNYKELKDLNQETLRTVAVRYNIKHAGMLVVPLRKKIIEEHDKLNDEVVDEDVDKVVMDEVDEYDEVDEDSTSKLSAAAKEVTTNVDLEILLKSVNVNEDKLSSELDVPRKFPWKIAATAAALAVGIALKSYSHTGGKKTKKNNKRKKRKSLKKRYKTKKRRKRHKRSHNKRYKKKTIKRRR